MFFLVFFFLGDFGVIGEFRELSFILYHLARLGVRMLHAACCVEEY